MVFMLEATSLMGLCYDGEGKVRSIYGGGQICCLAMACVKLLQNLYVASVFLLQTFLRNLFSRIRLAYHGVVWVEELWFGHPFGGGCCLCGPLA